MEYLVIFAVGPVVYLGSKWLLEGALRETPEAKRARLEAAIARNTDGWTKPLIVATYAEGPAGLAVYRDEAPILAEHGYFAAGHIAEGSHVHAGRLIITGGLSALAGQEGIRSKGSFTITYRREGDVRKGS